MTFHKVGVCAVVRSGGNKVLLWRGDRKIPDATLMGFPGGKLEVGETLEQCCIRELREETGLWAERGLRYLTSIAHKWNDAKWLTVYFEVLSYSGVLQNHEPDKHDSFDFYDVASVNFDRRKFYMGTEAVLKEMGLLR